MLAKQTEPRSRCNGLCLSRLATNTQGATVESMQDGTGAISRMREQRRRSWTKKFELLELGGEDATETLNQEWGNMGSPFTTDGNGTGNAYNASQLYYPEQSHSVTPSAGIIFAKPLRYRRLAKSPFKIKAEKKTPKTRVSTGEDNVGLFLGRGLLGFLHWGQRMSEQTMRTAATRRSLGKTGTNGVLGSATFVSSCDRKVPREGTRLTRSSTWTRPS